MELLKPTMPLQPIIPFEPIVPLQQWQAESEFLQRAMFEEYRLLVAEEQQMLKEQRRQALLDTGIFLRSFDSNPKQLVWSNLSFEDKHSRTWVLKALRTTLDLRDFRALSYILIAGGPQVAFDREVLLARFSRDNWLEEWEQYLPRLPSAGEELDDEELVVWSTTFVQGAVSWASDRLLAA